MKKLFLIFSLLFLGYQSAEAQNSAGRMTVNILCEDAENVNKQLKDLLAGIENARVTSVNDLSPQYNIKRQISMTVTTDDKGFEAINELLEKAGFTDTRQLQTVDHTADLSQIQIELDFLEKQSAIYTKELEKTKQESENYFNIFNRLRDMERQTFDLEKRRAALRQEVAAYICTITLTEQSEMPGDTYQGPEFVNMPGVQYKYLMIENPDNSISSKSYQGLTLKYMFTRGKSFVEFGAFKSIQEVSELDSGRFKELFTYGFGQDFYPRHLGRGRNKFLNLYTGYTLGGIFATSENRSQHIFWAVPRFGVELFKNKNVLLDTNVGYFIPFTENRRMRGLMLNASFNFLF